MCFFLLQRETQTSQVVPASRPFHSALSHGRAPEPHRSGSLTPAGRKGLTTENPCPRRRAQAYSQPEGRDGTAWPGPKQTSRRRDPKAAGRGGRAAEAPALRRRRRRGDRGRGGGGGQPAPHLFSFAPFRTSLVDLTQEYSAMSGYGKRGRTHAAPPRRPDGSPGATSFAGPRSVIC